MDGMGQGDGVQHAAGAELNESDPDGRFDQWAVVDVMGHQRYVGKVSEQTIAGKGFIRIDVPAVGDRLCFTKLLGTGSIYAISPVSEQVARAMCEQLRQAPIAEYDLPKLPSGTSHLVDDEADYEVDSV
ncbi:MAG: hypothetical protein AAFV88_14030 [Planctomycetota bacterium]